MRAAVGREGGDPTRPRRAGPLELASLKIAIGSGLAVLGAHLVELARWQARISRCDDAAGAPARTGRTTSGHLITT